MKKFKSKLVETFLWPILGILGCFFITIFTILSVPIFIFRFMLILLAQLIRSDLGEILNGQSNIFVNELFGNKPLRSNIIICHTMTGHFTLDEMKDLVLTNWIQAIDKKTGRLTYAKFQQFPVKWCGFAFYKNAFGTFNIDDHVHSHETLGGNLPSVTEEDVVEFSEKLLNTSYRPKASPWEIHLVQNYHNPKISSEKMSLLIIKIHHSLADGYSLLDCLVGALGECPISEVKMPISKVHPKRSLTEQILSIMTFPIVCFSEMSIVLGQILRQSPWKVPDHKKEWYQYCAKSDPIPVSTIAEIKNALGVTFTSVLVSSVSAAITEHFEVKIRKGQMEPNDNSSLYCFNALPVIGHQKILTNHATGSMFDIPIAPFSHPVERLRRCNSILEAVSQNSTIPSLLKYFSTLFGCHLTSVGGFILKNRAVSTGLTNFPSVPITLVKNGKVFISADFIVGGLEGCAGVGIMILSYNGNIRVAISSEKAIMSKEETNTIVLNIKNEIHRLHAIVKSSSNPKSNL